MKLTIEDIKRIEQEIKEQEEYYEDDYGFYYSLIHEEAGDRV